LIDILKKNIHEKILINIYYKRYKKLFKNKSDIIKIKYKYFNVKVKSYK